MESVTPTAVEVDRQVAVSITWPDAQVDRFELAELRANCPCAACRGEREQGKVPGAGRTNVIADAELVGAWGLSLTWDDGHSTGIYPWEILYAWALDTRNE
ncbi:MAG: gamma-butyrobetaine hydroxylase-like domain-containing protein [Acidimicrobiia bacterium]